MTLKKDKLSEAIVTAINNVQKKGGQTATRPIIFIDASNQLCVRAGNKLYDSIMGGLTLRELGKKAYNELGISFGKAYGATDQQLVYLVGRELGIVPKRIQHKRTKGWKKPDNAVIITRPGKFGNPFPVSRFGRERSIELFRIWFNGGWDNEMVGLSGGRLSFDEHETMLEELKDKILCCWCKPNEPCHGDVYAEMLAMEKVTK